MSLIHRLQSLEAERDAAREEAERANLAKSKFLAAASHDLRQPLQALFFLSAALARHVGDHSGRDLLSRLDQGLDTMKGLLDGLLEVSRLEAGVVTPVLDNFAVSEITDALDAAYGKQAADKGLVWRVEGCDGVLRSDRGLLMQLLCNLVDNALRYTEAGAIRIRCRVDGGSGLGEGSGTEAGQLAIEVQDTGIGIPPEHLDRIFEEFHQVDNPERDRLRGLGLGLAIVRRLSQLLDHPVQVRSVPGRGSAFRVLVPLAPARFLAAGTGGAERLPGIDRPRLAVLVDDDAVVLLGLQTVLTEWGFRVVAADGTDRAMDRLAALGRAPDLVIADYRLREGRVGTEVIRRVRERYGAAVPALILTGETGIDTLADASAHGVAVLHKPVTPRQLQAEVGRQLRDSGQLQDSGEDTVQAAQ